MTPSISVVTPTYERAGTLPRLYRSLCEQGFVDFEWVVVDDGSSDGTEQLVRGWAGEAPFDIHYSWQPNQGKHAAVNRGVERSRGDFCAVMDSDDWYAPQALQRMIESWQGIPGERRHEFANVEGLCAEPGGSVIGDRFPAPVFDSNAFEIEVVHGVRGDKIGMYRREVLLRFPFPEDLGWHVTPALVWNRIAARFSSRYVDEVWAFKEYLAEGLSARETRNRLWYPGAQLLYWREFAAIGRPMPARARLRSNANVVRYTLLTGGSLRELLADSSSRAWSLVAIPAGLLLFLRDRGGRRRAAAEAGP